MKLKNIKLNITGRLIYKSSVLNPDDNTSYLTEEKAQ